MVDKGKKSAGKGKAKLSTAAKQRTLLDMFSKPPVGVEMLNGEGSGSTIAAQPSENSFGQLPATLQSSATGSPHSGPIIIEDTPPPTSRPPTDAASSPISIYDLSSDGGSSPPAVIVIDSSPIKASAFNPSSKAVHPFFATRAPVRSTPASSPYSQPLTWDTPYPDGCSQHVKGPQSVAPSSQNPLSSRTLSRLPYLAPSDLSPTSTYSFLASGEGETHVKPLCEWSKTLEPCQTSITGLVETIPKEHVARHPAISRTLDRIGSPTSSHSLCETWTERWRPRSSDQVIGNEAGARYLRDWLLALKLQAEAPVPDDGEATRKGKKSIQKRSKKRPRIITETGKGRARKRIKTDSDEENDWIVYTDNEEGDELDPIAVLDLDSQPIGLPTWTSSQSSQHVAAYDLGQLHNTILLTGPPGTGKTASVYACAEELGWEVFEVYPGVGRRNGGNVELLVGEVGKNHLVRHQPQAGHNFLGLSSPTKRRTTLNTPLDPGRSDSRSIREGSAKGNNPQTSDDDQAPSMAQSLILLEEVDVLFKEDTNFWPTVIKIIKECKRPVILTYMTLVPLSDLPIQRVLDFVPCPAAAQLSYLQSLTYAEGRSLTRQGLERFLESRRSEEPEPWKGNHVSYDLRHAINLLQVFAPHREPAQSGSVTLSTDGAISSQEHPSKAPKVSSVSDTKESVLELLAQWKRDAHEAETRSFLDSQLGDDLTGLPSMEETHAPCDDDEIGHIILFDTRREATLPTVYPRHEQIRLAVEELLPSEVDRKLHLMETVRSETEMLSAQKMFQSDVYQVLREVCPQYVWKSPLPHLYLDYGPYIRQIAEGDDAQAEAMILRVQERGGRKTRNSGLTEYVRTIRLGDLGRSSISRICYKD